jgi:hypothetical protein
MNLKCPLSGVTLRFFPENLNEVSDEHGESFNQHIMAVKSGTKVSEVKYVGRLLLDNEEGCT